jgi:hypothetical protein
MPLNESEMRKNIATAVAVGSPVIFFDNVKDYFDSAALDALITESGYRDRRLNTNTDIASAAHGITAFITGNDCTWTRDSPINHIRSAVLLDEIQIHGSERRGRRAKDWPSSSPIVEPYWFWMAWSHSKIRLVHKKDAYVSLPSRRFCSSLLPSIRGFA